MAPALSEASCLSSTATRRVRGWGVYGGVRGGGMAHDTTPRRTTPPDHNKPFEHHIQPHRMLLMWTIIWMMSWLFKRMWSGCSLMYRRILKICGILIFTLGVLNE